MARIAVVGAGMASMAAAARLATAGHTVVVHERTETYGGAVGRFTRDGFCFDTGPGLLLLPAVYRDLFVKTGRESLEQAAGLVQIDPASRHVFADGTDVTLPNASRSGVIDALDAACGPGSGERWSEVLARAREAWEAMRRPLLEEPLPSDTAPLAADPYPAARPPRSSTRTTSAPNRKATLRARHRSYTASASARIPPGRYQTPNVCSTYGSTVAAAGAVRGSRPYDRA